jgi:hypothetical protein
MLATRVARLLCIVSMRRLVVAVKVTAELCSLTSLREKLIQDRRQGDQPWLLRNPSRWLRSRCRGRCLYIPMLTARLRTPPAPA